MLGAESSTERMDKANITEPRWQAFCKSCFHSDLCTNLICIDERFRDVTWSHYVTGYDEVEVTRGVHWVMYRGNNYGNIWSVVPNVYVDIILLINLQLLQDITSYSWGQCSWHSHQWSAFQEDCTQSPKFCMLLSEAGTPVRHNMHFINNTTCTASTTMQSILGTIARLRRTILMKGLDRIILGKINTICHSPLQIFCFKVRLCFGVMYNYLLSSPLKCNHRVCYWLL